MQNLQALDLRRGFSQKVFLFIFVLAYFFFNGVSIAKSKIIIISSRQTPEHFGNEKRKVSESQIKLIEEDLRKKTGLEGLGFNEYSELVYDVLEEPKSGSEKLREAITGAIEDEFNIFQIIDYSNSRAIQFALTDEGTIDVNTDITTYKLKFDFADFKNSKKYSDSEALDSFTLGITLFHEIDHKVSYNEESPHSLYGVRAETHSGGFSGVIENVNLVRRELGLIPRDTKRLSGKRYRKNIYEIPFVVRSGKYKFLRWEIKRR